MQNPSLNSHLIDSSRESSCLLGRDDGIPPFEIRFSIVGVNKSLQNKGNMIDIFLEIAINIILFEEEKFLENFYPVVSGSVKINIVDAAAGQSAYVVKILFEGIHDDGCRDGLVEFVGGGKVACKGLNHSFVGVFFDGFDNFVKKVIPLFLLLKRLLSRIHQLHNLQVDLPFVLHKCVAQLFGITVHIF